MPHAILQRQVPVPPPIPGQYHIYFLRCADGSIYIGQTGNLPERLRKHHYGLGSRHTSEHPPVSLLYVEGPYFTLTAALRRERQLKTWSRAKKEALASGDYERLHALASSRQATMERWVLKKRVPAPQKDL